MSTHRGTLKQIQGPRIQDLLTTIYYTSPTHIKGLRIRCEREDQSERSLQPAAHHSTLSTLKVPAHSNDEGQTPSPFCMCVIYYKNQGEWHSGKHWLIDNSLDSNHDWWDASIQIAKWTYNQPNHLITWSVEKGFPLQRCFPPLFTQQR